MSAARVSKFVCLPWTFADIDVVLVGHTKARCKQASAADDSGQGGFGTGAADGFGGGANGFDNVNADSWEDGGAPDTGAAAESGWGSGEAQQGPSSTWATAPAVTDADGW